MVSYRIIFVITFVLALVVQSTLWKAISFTDEELWMRRVVRLVQDVRGVRDDSMQVRYSGHPGTAVLSVAALAHGLGVPLRASLVGGVALINSLVIAGVFTACKMARPASLWWLAAGAIILFHPLYYHCSPTNAVIAPLTVLIFVMTLLVYKDAKRYKSFGLLTWLLGLVMGVALATRFAVGAAVTSITVVWLVPRIGWRAVFRVGLAAVAGMVLLDPLMWFAPVDHVRLLLSRAYLHAVVIDYTSLRAMDFVLFAPLALLALGWSVILALSPSRWRLLPLPRQFLLLLLVVTLLLSTVFIKARSQALRYFYPLIFTWEAFLPLFLLHLIGFVRFPFLGSAVQQRWRGFLRVGLVSLLTFSQIFLLVYIYDLPAREYLVDWQYISELITQH